MLIIRRIAIFPGYPRPYRKRLCATDCSTTALTRKAEPSSKARDGIFSAIALLVCVRRLEFSLGGALRRQPVETSLEILTKPVDNGSDLAVLFPFAPKRAFAGL